MKNFISIIEEEFNIFLNDTNFQNPLRLTILTGLLLFTISALIYKIKKIKSKKQQNKNLEKSIKNYQISSKDTFLNALKKTREGLATELDKLFGGKIKNDNEFYERLEETLISSDIGITTANTLIEALKNSASSLDSKDRLKILKTKLKELLSIEKLPLETNIKPSTLLVIGVNGVGKTTTIGKIAYNLKSKNKQVVLAAGDTFRAAAIEQLSIWGDRCSIKTIKHKHGSDPSAVVHDAISHSLAQGNTDYIIVDTAGRLHTKKNLTEELKKIKRTIKKLLPKNSLETMLVLDATTGQNALSQAKLFNKEIGIDSITITKLDGTAKGGVLISIINELKIPVKYMGLGEKIEDLKVFDPELFVDSLFKTYK
jgi:fused signal recognition particle receptor